DCQPELDALAELPAGPQVEAAMRVVDAVDPSRGVQVHVVAGPEHRTGVAPGEEAREAAPTVLEAERGDGARHVGELASHRLRFGRVVRDLVAELVAERRRHSEAAPGRRFRPPE